MDLVVSVGAVIIVVRMEVGGILVSRPVLIIYLLILIRVDELIISMATCDPISLCEQLLDQWIILQLVCVWHHHVLCNRIQPAHGILHLLILNLVSL